MIPLKKNVSYSAFIWSVVLIFCVIVFFLWPAAVNNSDIESAKEEGFVLQSAMGPVALADYRGKVVVLYFGYAFCPDVCPTSLGILSLALNELSAEELGNVQPLFISVDPERDTVERLKTYAEAFHPSIIGITGSTLDIAEVSQQYDVLYMKVEMPDSALGYSVDHSSMYYVINRDGTLNQKISHGTDPKKIAEVLRRVLN